jgi:hypothetical protein
MQDDAGTVVQYRPRTGSPRKLYVQTQNKEMFIGNAIFRGFYLPDNQHPGMILLDLETEEWYELMKIYQEEEDFRFDRVHPHFVSVDEMYEVNYLEDAGTRYQHDSVVRRGAALYARNPHHLRDIRTDAETELLEVLHLSDHNPSHGTPRFTTWEILEREIRALKEMWLSHWTFFHVIVDTDFNGPMTVENTRLEDHHAAEIYRIALVVDQADRLNTLLLKTSGYIYLSDMKKLEHEDLIRLSWWTLETMELFHRPRGRGSRPNRVPFSGMTPIRDVSFAQPGKFKKTDFLNRVALNLYGVRQI